MTGPSASDPDVSTDQAKGWLAVAVAFLCNATGFGILYSFGVFFSAIVLEFEKGRGSTSWIISIAVAVMLGAGAFVGRAADRFGTRIMIIAGAILMASGLFASSLARNIFQVYAAYGLLLGIGVCCLFLPSTAAVGKWFTKRRGLATGVAVAGSGVGTIVMAPVSAQLIATSDWRGASQKLAALVLVTMFLAVLLVREKKLALPSGPRASMFRDRRFRLLYASAFFASYGYFVPFFHLAPLAMDRGFSTARAALLLSIMGGANTLGRIVLGALADRLGRLRVFQLSMAVMGLATMALPFANTYKALIAFGLVYGGFAGTFISLLPALTGDYFGVMRLAGVMGLLNTGAALGSLLGSPVTGFLFDASGDYVGGLITAGLSIVIGFAFLLRLPQPQDQSSGGVSQGK